eukprot:77274-Chlamydomonas_euryale.AAC.10
MLLLRHHARQAGELTGCALDRPTMSATTSRHFRSNRADRAGRLMLPPLPARTQAPRAAGVAIEAASLRDECGSVAAPGQRPLVFYSLARRRRASDRTCLQVTPKGHARQQCGRSCPSERGCFPACASTSWCTACTRKN